MAKGFDQSAPMSPLRRATRVGHPDGGAIRLVVNDAQRQASDLSQQIWSVPDMLAHLSKLVRLMPGDLVMTGTPEGVGPVRDGDRLVATGRTAGGTAFPELTVTARAEDGGKAAG